MPAAYSEVVLALADRDGSGEIEFAEFKAMLANLETPDTLIKLEGLLGKMAGDQQPAGAPPAQAKAVSKEWRPVGTRDTWLAIQSECQIISKDEGLLAYKGRTYQQQDPGGGKVLVVDLESGHIIYWNKFFTPSRQDLEDFRRRQFAETRAELLESNKDQIEAVEAALLQDKVALSIRATRRAAEYAARKKEQEKKERKQQFEGGEGGALAAPAAGAPPDAAALDLLGDGGQERGLAGVGKVGEMSGGGGDKVQGMPGLVGGRVGGRSARVMAVKSKEKELGKMPPLQMLHRDKAAVSSKIKAEAEMAHGQLEMLTFQRVAALLQFLLDQVWIEIVLPGSPAAAGLGRAFQRLPFGGSPLDYTKRGRAAAHKKKDDDGEAQQEARTPVALSKDDVMDGVWCLVDLPPTLQEGAPFTLTVGGLEGAGTCPAGCAGLASGEAVLSPLMHYARKEWMVTGGSAAGSADDDIDPESDLLECARKHADFYKRDLYVTTPAIVKFLQTELGMPRKGTMGRKSFVFTAKQLRKRLAEEGWALPKKGSDQDKKRPSLARN